MNTCFRRLAVTAFLLLPFCLSRAAFNPAIVAADAKWVVYADLNALRESTLGKEFIAAGKKNLDASPGTSGIKFDVDQLFAAVGNVTAYGSNFSAKAEAIDGALVIEGTGFLRKIAEGWAAQATLTKPERFKEVTGLPFPAYSLGNEMVVGFPVEPVILISKSTPHLVKAWEVFRGDRGSLAKAATSPLARLLAKAGSAYGVAASVVPSEQVIAMLSAKNQGPQARIFELTDTGMFSIGEEGQRTVAQAELVAKSSGAANKLLKIVQGLLAMISLTENNDRQLAEFLASAVAEKQGQSVILEMSYSSDRLVQMMQSSQQRALTGPAKRALSPALSPATFGRVVEEWKLDKGAAGAAADAVTLSSHSIPNVRLVTGSVVALSSQRKSGGNTFIDRIEIFPMAGGPGLRFKMENMRLMGYSTINRKLPSSERVKLVGSVRPFAVAQFEFPGEEGDYMVHVHYVEEAAGTTTLALSVKDPQSAPTP